LAIKKGKLPLGIIGHSFYLAPKSLKLNHETVGPCAACMPVFSGVCSKNKGGRRKK
jgi:hypothetical protein